MLLNKLLNVLPVLCTKQTVRTTCVFKRMFPPRQCNPEKMGPSQTKLKRKHYVYTLIDHVNSRPAGDIDLILTSDVDGLGFKGDIVRVKKKLARGEMLPTGVAIYASPDNIAKTEHIREQNKGRIRQTESGHRMLKELGGMTLPIPMSPVNEWTLSKTQVKVAFRTCAVELSEDCLKLPDEDITKPGEYYVQVTVNNLDTIPVKMYVYHHNKTSSVVLPLIWSKDPKHKFDMIEVLAEATKNVNRRSI